MRRLFVLHARAVRPEHLQQQVPVLTGVRVTGFVFVFGSDDDRRAAEAFKAFDVHSLLQLQEHEFLYVLPPEPRHDGPKDLRLVMKGTI